MMVISINQPANKLALSSSNEGEKVTSAVPQNSTVKKVKDPLKNIDLKHQKVQKIIKRVKPYTSHAPVVRYLMSLESHVSVLLSSNTKISKTARFTQHHAAQLQLNHTPWGWRLMGSSAQLIIPI